MQKEDKRQIELWKRFLGADFDVSRLSRREWDSFIRMRRSGEIDALGHVIVKADDRRPVGGRVVGKDLAFLRAACSWACDFREGGRLLLERDPTRGYELPTEKNPARPVATDDRVDAIRKVYRSITMRISRGSKQETVESYLPEIFEVAVGTGRRISAVLQLRQEDLNLERTVQEPHGAIVWPADTDKMRKEWRCPVSAAVRKALESAMKKRQRLGHVGPGYLFPSPEDPRSQ